MKILHYGFALMALCLAAPSVANAASISDFFPNCASPPSDAGHTVTVNPSGFSNGADPNLSAALSNAKAGDTIALMTGDYGNLTLNTVNQNGFVTIAAASGQNPRFTKIDIGGFKPASHWRLTGLTVSNFSPPFYNGRPAHGSLIMISNSDNIILQNNFVNSQDGEMGWQPEAAAAVASKATSSGISARQASCVSIVENSLRNIFNGIDFGGDQIGDHGKYFLISGNSIDNFAGDGIDHYGSHGRIENNRITNGHDICNNECIHNDGIQGWNFNHLPVHNSDIVIDGNVIIAQITPDLVLPIDTLQGITIFDGKWDGVRIFNNLIVTNAWHGITLNRVKDASIINNTIAPTNPSRNTWIMVNGDKEDPPGTSYNVIVRNNVVPGNLKGGSVVLGVVSDHNLGLKSAENYADAFVKFDREHFDYDLHPARSSPVKGEGSPDGAPAADIEGRPRHVPIDIGAYSSGK